MWNRMRSSALISFGRTWLKKNTKPTFQNWNLPTPSYHTQALGELWPLAQIRKSSVLEIERFSLRCRLWEKHTIEDLRLRTLLSSFHRCTCLSWAGCDTRHTCQWYLLLATELQTLQSESPSCIPASHAWHSCPIWTRTWSLKFSGHVNIKAPGVPQGSQWARLATLCGFKLLSGVFQET